MEPYKASVKFDISYEPPRHFLRQRESHILSEPVSNYLFSSIHACDAGKILAGLHLGKRSR